MASKATHASLWLPGFEIDAPAYPDLFSSNDEAAAPAADLSADSGESATADTAGDLPRPWRPATAQATQPTADNPAITWPQWTDSVLGGLEGQATKFNANIEAIAVLRADVAALVGDRLRAAGAEPGEELSSALAPEVVSFINQHLDMTARGPFLVGLGAVGPGHEWAIPHMFPPLIDGLRRAGFSEEEINWMLQVIGESLAEVVK